MTDTQTPTTPASLTGIRVVDLTRVLGGPYCTQILADHGAEVLKIEPPAGDETRGWGPPFIGDTAAYFMGVNRNKKGLVADLSTQSGQLFLRELLSQADVLIENFKPGTLEKWGLGKDALQEAFPHLIHCCISGFGADGPLGGLPGYDACAQALCGLMSVNGEKSGEPTRVGLPVVDMVTGLNAAIAVLLALNERRSSGLGQYLDISLFDCAVSLLHPHAPNYFANGKVPGLTGNAHPNIAPYESFPTASGELFLAVGNNRQFATLCSVLKRPDIAQDPRFIDNAQRLGHRQLLHETLCDALAAHQAAELADVLMKAGVPASPVNNVAQLLAHPHTSHRNMVVEQGSYRAINTPIKLSRTPAQFRSPPPGFGEHNQEYGIN
ncbi:CaiB/BaiF CoA transferase family protein [Advenella mimigardefordensis]|uniref:Putative acyl-CoA transferase family 3 n=1 Tax=Advenella mimigardefordensis (strain DSM 17166 / LMG 22922 / DPN7) TaxID=1247726 RepID=W0PF94_ADVMD|nr:CoA transferase [Advenella mimigardefordensis]AHG63718.1 putative acyl-CoA transferase family 3 [Advenella mimigardefordensis DPN7]